MQVIEELKLAVISGGSRGLGAALCSHYLNSGYEVVEFSRNAPHTYSVRTDFSRPESAVGAISEELSRLAMNSYDEIVIINNAGTLQPIGPAARKEGVVVIANLNVNLLSAILFLSEAIRQLQDHAGKKTIVNISSGAALKGYFGWSLYCAAKAGMENFIRSVALEQEAEIHPFFAISIDPGVMDTEMQAAIRAANEKDFPTIGRFVEFKKSGALRPAAQVAELVARIVSQNSATGLRYSVSDFIDG